MNETAHSAPADHAVDYSRRYAEDLEIVAGQAMMDLGIADHQMGAPDHTRNSEIHSFFPGDREGGRADAGQITLDSGMMNPDFLLNYDEVTGTMWRRTRIADRAQAIIAHELAEHEHGGDHELAHRWAGNDASHQQLCKRVAQADGEGMAGSLRPSRCASRKTQSASVRREAPSGPLAKECSGIIIPAFTSSRQSGRVLKLPPIPRPSVDAADPGRHRLG
jgi:hypothetical protein